MNTKNLITFNFRSTDQLIKVQNNLLEVIEDFKTDSGFFNRYFHILPFFKNKEDAFLCVNVQYFKTYNKFKYNSYDAFKNNIESIKVE
ncbi:hypothetical protein OS188_02065 [Xanthomarina sp. F1114]|uniref:hypothetical protein n=1 Tax=Xanthomarina sp. F1114 TaxID=2996019 RepID=UPI00225E312C|nr:hypothetical protein [Xanthomarina sp. F1114]MCX7546733.1 hypothetical protein [Xanthomarina sp. F1114]